MLGDAFASYLRRAQAGDEDAFAHLFRDFGPIVIRYLRVLARADAEDLAAETWLEIVRGLKHFSGDEAGFRGWVMTIARHRHAKRLRSLARRPSETPAEISLLRARAAQDTASVAEEELSTEAALELISTLPPDQAEVVVLRAVVGLRVDEVASLMGLRPGTVRVLAHRGLRRLEQVLRQQDESRNRVV